MTSHSISDVNFSGIGYDYTIKFSERAGYFEIVATHKQEQRQSSITNHNRILSDVCSGVIDADLIEETYIDQLTEQEVIALYDSAKNCFEDADWVANILESELDTDRMESEWGLLEDEK
jgi:HD superfamily phosphohydrolase